MIFFEDLHVGRKDSFGSCRVTREEVLEFAHKYDPQGFHLSDEEAAKTHFGRLAASGWHVCSMYMAMMVDHFAAIGYQGLGSPGVDELRWVKPVHPGDTLRCEAEVLSLRRSQSRPEMGIAKGRATVFNQHGDVVMRLLTTDMVRVRGD